MEKEPRRNRVNMKSLINNQNNHRDSFATLRELTTRLGGKERVQEMLEDSRRLEQHLEERHRLWMERHNIDSP